jgi:glycogen operon protein
MGGAMAERARVPWADMVIYEAHVRGFTNGGFAEEYPCIPDDQLGTYTAMGLPSVVSYLKDLGVTTLQLMSVHHFVPERELIQRGLTNYWGYNPIGYFAPEARYSSVGSLWRAGARVQRDDP